MTYRSMVRVGDIRIGREEKEAINKVLDSGRITEGERTREFEKKFAQYIGTKYSVALSSGTAALISGLTAIKYLYEDIKVKSKVLTAPVTYIATSNAIVLSGFDPVYVDIDPLTFGITPENIKKHLESVDDPAEYSIILPVHLMGVPCDMNGINKIAKKFGLFTFEDAAQSIGSRYEGGRTGSLSLLSDFSFYIAHNIQVGEMGAIVTDSIELWKLIKRIKANGRMCDCSICTRALGKCPKATEDDPRFTHDLIGYNFKTMEFQAVLALAQLEKADWIMKRRQENVKYLNEGLDSFSNILTLPLYSEDVSYMAYTLVIKDPDKISRKTLCHRLEKRGVETRPLFGCIPTQQPAYTNLKKSYKGKLPNADYIGLNGFYIGCHQYLTPDDLDHVIKSFKKVLKDI